MKAEKKIPQVMPFQMEPFNGDTFVEAEILKLKERFNLTKAIELGTCFGSSSIWLAKHFDLVHTVEINPEFHEIAQERFLKIRGDHTLCNWLGNSVEVLPMIFSMDNKHYKVDERCFMFIDSHWGENVPLLKELAIIAQYKMKPVIAIHDFQVPGRSDLGYDVYHNQAFNFNWIKPSLDLIYKKDFLYHYNGEAKGAKRGVIFIYPNDLEALEAKYDALEIINRSE